MQQQPYLKKEQNGQPIHTNQQRGKILFILPFPPATGADGRKKEAIETMIEAHLGLGFEVATVSLQPEADSENSIYKLMPIDSKIFRGFNHRRPGLTKTILLKLWRISLIIAIRKDRGVKVIFAYSMTTTTSRFAARLKKIYGIPYIINEHRSDYQRLYPDPAAFPPSEREVLEEALIVLALTEPHKNQIQKFSKCKVKVEVVPLVLSNDFFRNISSSALPKSTVTLAAWTSWRSLKRLDLLLAAFLLCKNKFEQVELKIAGPFPEPDQEKFAQEFIRKNRLEKSVEILGPLDREKIQSLAYACDICVIPSDHETFGLPATEALCAGKLVVTTKCGGPETFITEGVDGFTVKTNSKEELASGIEKAIALLKSADSKKIAQNARGKFSIDALKTSLADIYKSLVL